MLHVFCLLLCKICSPRNSDVFRSSQNQVRNWQGKNSAMALSAISWTRVIKMLLTTGFQQTTPNNRAEPVEIWKARKFIEENSVEELSLKKVAKAVNISANHPSEKFKQVTGVNFVEHIARIRFENASELLRNPNLRISEIAFAVGFQSLSQFNRVFKRFARKSPSQYRADVSSDEKGFFP